MSQILEKLYIGDINVANDMDLLEKLGITHVLICGSFLEPSFPDVNFDFVKN